MEFADYAAGSGISEVKSILSGYVLRGFLGSSTLFVKTFGLAFSVASGLSLGKEGPFVHCACCVANLVTRFFRKYNHNEAKRREILSAACAAGVAAAFGAPAGGVLFSLEETSYYFGKLCLWRSFACSTITYAITRTLSPHANGKATMLGTSFSRTYTYHEFAAFVVLGIFGGLYGAWFCASNIAWSRNVRSKTFLGRHPIGEVALIALLTLLVQYWNPFTALEGPRLLSELFSECLPDDERFLCYRNRTGALAVFKSLGVGFLIKALLTVVTFGIKIPAGVFIPTLAAGALAGRALAIIVHLVALTEGEWALLGQCHYSSVTCILPARWALLGATAALVGVTRSTVSLAVIVIELTGTLSESLPILVVTVFAKLTADAFNKLSIYELVIQMNGLPYLEPSLDLGDLTPCDIADLYAPCIHTEADNTIGSLRKLLKRCSGRVAGFPILRNTEEGKRVVGYIALQDLALGLTQIGTTDPDTPCMFRPPSTGGFYSGLSTPSSCNLGNLMDSSPLLVTMRSPTELLQELFVKLGTRCCMVTDDNSCYVGVIEKDRWIAYLEWTQGKQESPFGHDL